MDANLTAIEDLIKLVEDEAGLEPGGICHDSSNDEPVGTGSSGPLPMTFGHVRAARNALENLKMDPNWKRARLERIKAELEDLGEQLSRTNDYDEHLRLEKRRADLSREGGRLTREIDKSERPHMHR